MSPSDRGGSLCNDHKRGVGEGKLSSGHTKEEREKRWGEVTMARCGDGRFLSISVRSFLSSSSSTSFTVMVTAERIEITIRQTGRGFQHN